MGLFFGKMFFFRDFFLRLSGSFFNGNIAFFDPFFPIAGPFRVNITRLILLYANPTTSYTSHEVALVTTLLE
jgi:hypothetical protein